MIEPKKTVKFQYSNGYVGAVSNNVAVILEAKGQGKALPGQDEKKEEKLEEKKAVK